MVKRQGQAPPVWSPTSFLAYFISGLGRRERTEKDIIVPLSFLTWAQYHSAMLGWRGLKKFPGKTPCKRQDVWFKILQGPFICILGHLFHFALYWSYLCLFIHSTKVTTMCNQLSWWEKPDKVFAFTELKKKICTQRSLYKMLSDNCSKYICGRDKYLRGFGLVKEIGMAFLRK